VADQPYLTRAPIEPAALLRSVGEAGLGAVTLFVGLVRRSAEDGPVAAIEYTAYDAMLEAEWERILAEAKQRWPGLRVAACHRLGLVPVGEASIAVAAAAPHRAEAFAGCRYVIEEAKRRLPVWKQEIFDDGTRRWRADQAVGREAAPPQGGEGWDSPSS
jgi:molybdopterin synthase catalytic subunit